MEGKPVIHVIRKGDTLYLLSRRYHVPVEAILYANPYMDIYNLQVGDEIYIPGGSGLSMDGGWYKN